MSLLGKKTTWPIEEFLTNPTTPVVIDVRGCPDSDPAIPGSRKVYVLEIDERPEAFEQRFATLGTSRPLLLYCSKGDASRFLLDRLPGKHPAYSLQGGMVTYLTTLSRLLHEHPYEDPSKRGDTMVRILSALTNRHTDPAIFRKILDRLLRCTPNPKFRKLIAGIKP